MFPIRDDTPRFSTPFITYFIIALNVVVFLYELAMGAQSQRALNAFVAEFGVVPRHETAVAGCTS
jgi:membrane associated rhomboid family serine protease